MKKTFLFMVFMMMGIWCVTMTSCGGDDPAPTQQTGNDDKEEGNGTTDNSDNPNKPDETVKYQYVDLGLPSGTLWATFNVGATKPEESGDYFAWGETASDGKIYKGDDDQIIKNYFDWPSYKYCNGGESDFELTKYCQDKFYGYRGFTDGKTELDLADDVAYNKWGMGWRMPSSSQMEELIDGSYTTLEWTVLNHVAGLKITGKKNGNSIFLPAAGHRVIFKLADKDTVCHYWARSLYTNQPSFAFNLVFGSDGGHADYITRRCYGLSVRPVRNQ